MDPFFSSVAWEHISPQDIQTLCQKSKGEPKKMRNKLQTRICFKYGESKNISNLNKVCHTREDLNAISDTISLGVISFVERNIPQSPNKKLDNKPSTLRMNMFGDKFSYREEEDSEPENNDFERLYLEQGWGDKSSNLLANKHVSDFPIGTWSNPPSPSFSNLSSNSDKKRSYISASETPSISPIRVGNNPLSPSFSNMSSNSDQHSESYIYRKQDKNHKKGTYASSEHSSSKSSISNNGFVRGKSPRKRKL